MVYDNDPEELSLPEKDLEECAYCGGEVDPNDSEALEDAENWFCNSDCRDAYKDEVAEN